ncbi:MAG: HlyD family secretion protein [Planctomycetaceae bacterium]|nr:HlyD family secretion protein [Planctomycetaceae bacterium]
MMWLLGGTYCLLLWLIFSKLKLLRFSLPIAIVAGSIGPLGILALLFCAQYYHPLTNQVLAFQKVVPIVPRMNAPGRVTEIHVEPNIPVTQGDVLFEVDRVPYENAVARLTTAVSEAEQSVKVAEANVDVANASLARASSDADFATSERDRYQKLVASEAATQQRLDQAVASYEQAAAALNQASTGLKQATSSVELSQARLRQSQVALQDAQYDLDQSTVRAPGDGYVTNLQLQPGMLVGGPGAPPVMSFVQDRSESEEGVVVGLFEQKNYLLIKPGQYAEVMLDTYPGEVLTGEVQTTIDISGAGQLDASGHLPSDLGTGPPTRFAVRIQLDRGADLRIPAGVHGTAAVYTDQVQIAGIPIMFVIRAQSWLKYVL